MKTIEIKVAIDATDPEQVKAACDFLIAVGGLNQPSKKEAAAKPEKGEAAVKPEKEEKGTIKIEDIRALLTTKVDNYRSEIKEKLTELGAGNVSTLDKSKYAEFIEFLNGLE